MEEDGGKMSPGQGYRRNSTESLPGDCKSRVRAKRSSKAGGKGTMEIADDKGQD